MDSRAIYTLNEEYFDKIDSQEKAYILGFLYADGSISGGNKHCIRLCLSEKDKSILETINLCLNSNRPLYYYKENERNGYLCKPRYELNINNKHMTQSVIKLGLVPCKTHILTYPKWLNSELNSHFIRGYFDGDGSISHTSATDLYVFSLAGTKEFLSDVMDILIDNCKLNKTVLTFVKSIYVLNYGGSKQLCRIRDFLYKDSIICLQRKKDIFDKVIIKEKDIIPTENFVNLFNNTSTNKEIAKELGIAYKTVYNRLEKVGIKRGRSGVIINEIEVIRLYTKELLTAIEIGKLFSTTHTTIYKILRKNNIEIRDSHCALKTIKILNPQLETIRRMYIDEYKSLIDISKIYNVSENTILKFLKNNNISIRGQHDVFVSIIEENKNEVIKSYLIDKKSTESIARQYKVTGPVVRKFLKRWNIQR